MKWTEDEIERLKELNREGHSPKEIANHFPHRTYNSVKSKLVSLGLKTKTPKTIQVKGPDLGGLERQLLIILQKGKERDIIDLANEFDVGPKRIEDALYSLRSKGYNISTIRQTANLVKKGIPEDSPLKIDPREFFNGKPVRTYYEKDGKEHLIDFGTEFKFGAIADTHLGSKYERLDVLNTLYDVFEREGVKAVFHGGNYVDGEFYYNKYETYTHGFDEMIDNFIEKYPQREGIITYFISGDDHEGWWMQREGLDAGRVIEDRAREKGRNDLVYLGYQERDIVLEAERGKSLIRLIHAGGGTAYADSYSTQRMAESFQEGEKPHILLVGHYHKAIYHIPRGIHTVQLGTTQEQTRFMRKRKIKAVLGGWLITANQAPTGEINRFKPEFIGPFWDRDFYRSKNK